MVQIDFIQSLTQVLSDSISVSDSIAFKGSFSLEARSDATTLQGGATYLITPSPITGTGTLTIVDGDGNDSDPTSGVVGISNVPFADYLVEMTVTPIGFDVIVDSAAGQGFMELTELAKPGGRIALFGRTAGNISNLIPRTIFWKQLSIHGTTMGNNHEFKEMVNLISSKKIHPVIDSVYSPQDINLAFEKMDRGEQFGKIVIKINEF